MVLSFWLSFWDPLEVLAFVSFSRAVSSTAFPEAGGDSQDHCCCLFSCQHLGAEKFSMFGSLLLWVWGLAAVRLDSLAGHIVKAAPKVLPWAA